MSLTDIIEERRKERKLILSDLSRYSSDLRKKLGKVSVILFGSYARGDFNLWSDIDLLIISEAFSGVRFLDRPFLLTELEWNADLICWDITEARKMLKTGSWMTALQKAAVICDDYALFSGSGSLSR